MQAVRTYDPSNGTYFEIYAYKRIDGAMRYGMKKDRQFYALMWDTAYTHLETSRDEGPRLDGGAVTDEGALHSFSDGLLTAVARKLCGAGSMMDAATSEEAVARRAEWSRRLRILIEEMEQTPADGSRLLSLVYDGEMNLKAAGRTMGLNYGSARRLHDRTLEDLGARVRRRCSFDPA